MHRTLTAPTPAKLDSEIARLERAGWKRTGGVSVAYIDLSKETAPRSSPLYAMEYVQGMEKEPQKANPTSPAKPKPVANPDLMHK
jgi:hypothetical protein